MQGEPVGGVRLPACFWQPVAGGEHVPATGVVSAADRGGLQAGRGEL